MTFTEIRKRAEVDCLRMLIRVLGAVEADSLSGFTELLGKVVRQVSVRAALLLGCCW